MRNSLLYGSHWFQDLNILFCHLIEKVESEVDPGSANWTEALPWFVKENVLERSGSDQTVGGKCCLRNTGGASRRGVWVLQVQVFLSHFSPYHAVDESFLSLPLSLSHFSVSICLLPCIFFFVALFVLFESLWATVRWNSLLIKTSCFSCQGVKENHVVILIFS